MQTIKIGGKEFQANKNEAKDAIRIEYEIRMGYKDGAQRTADIWIRSAADSKALVRRQEIAKALGLVSQIQYI